MVTSGKGTGSRAGVSQEHGGKGGSFYARERAEVPVSPLSDSGQGTGHFFPLSLLLGILVKMRNLHRKRALLYFSIFVCAY